jgi:hypothetical protein
MNMGYVNKSKSKFIIIAPRFIQYYAIFLFPVAGTIAARAHVPMQNFSKDQHVPEHLSLSLREHLTCCEK